MQNTKKKRYCCTHVGCSFSFDRPYRLEQHLLLHKNIKLYSCPLNLCNKSYTSKSHLDRHINSSHLQPAQDILYNCPQCFKVFANRQNLKRHIKNHENKLLCDICKDEFKKKNQLTAHMFIHTGVKSFSCETCSAEFVTITEKKKHMRQHKTFNCPECNLTFAHWSKYINHKNTEHNKNGYTCNECRRNFKQRCHIVRHVKIHDVSTKFPCTYVNCNKFYSNSSNLKQHILTKHVRMVHECEICKMQLTTRASLLNHNLKVHENTKPKNIVPKTLATGRRERKDAGIPKISTLARLSGISSDILFQKEANETPCSVKDDTISVKIEKNE